MLREMFLTVSPGRWTSTACLVATLSLPAVAQQTQPAEPLTPPALLDAAQVIERLDAPLIPNANDGGIHQVSPETGVIELEAQWDDLDSDTIATRWIELARASLEINNPKMFRDLLQTLPPADQWDRLHEQVTAFEANSDPAKIRHQALLVLTARLTGDQETIKSSFNNLAELVKNDPYLQESIPRTRTNALSQPTEQQKPPDAEYRALLAHIAHQSESEWGARRVTMSRLVERFGEVKAEQLLRAALGSKITINVPEDLPTRELAQRLMLEMAQDVVVPQWNLVEGTQTIELWEAAASLSPQYAQLIQRHRNGQIHAAATAPATAPAATQARAGQRGPQEMPSALTLLFRAMNGKPAIPPDFDGESNLDVVMDTFRSGSAAHSRYLAALIAQNQTDLAAELLPLLINNLDQEALMYSLHSSESQGVAYDVTVKALRALHRPTEGQEPDGVIERRTEADALTDFGIGSGGISAGSFDSDPSSSQSIWYVMINLAIATNQTEKAVELIDELLQPNSSTQHRIQQASYLAAAGETDRTIAIMQSLAFDTEAQDHRDMRFAITQKLELMGRLLDRPELRAQAIEAMRFHARMGLSDPDMILEALDDLEPAIRQDLLMQTGAQAQRIIQSSLTSNRDEFWLVSDAVNTMQTVMFELVQVALETDASQASVLISESPFWYANKLTDLYDWRMRGSLEIQGVRLLIAEGKNDQALAVLKTYLISNLGDDDAYALLPELAGSQTLPILDALATLDRFEERPLIWKARHLLEAGDVEAAEKSALAAIAIDPSDGEEDRGDRMRAYAVLADVYRVTGDAEQAMFFDSVVQAIRASERADQLYAAGLQRAAAELYDQSLQTFADAYCIQSRLAIRYAEMGDMARATQHYQRAFELMPSSFGFVESHCFGCEGAFSGPLAQSIAEQVLTQLMQEQPNNPQVHYLLGYLRRSQGQTLKAMSHFKQAVAFAPDYFNAWEAISDLNEDNDQSSKLAELAAVNLTRLDPFGQRFRPQASNITDLRMLYAMLKQPELPEILRVDERFKDFEVELTASKQRLATILEDHQNFEAALSSNYYIEHDNPDSQRVRFANALTHDDTIEPASRLYQMAENMNAGQW